MTQPSPLPLLQVEKLAGRYGRKEALRDVSFSLDAGSVLTSSTRRPLSARRTAVAQASDVLPTPPLPVKKTNRGKSARNVTTALASTILPYAVWARQQQPPPPQHPPLEAGALAASPGEPVVVAGADTGVSPRSTRAGESGALSTRPASCRSRPRDG